MKQIIFVGLSLVATGASVYFGARLFRAGSLAPPAALGNPIAPGLPGDIGLRFIDVHLIGRSNGKRAWLLDAGRVDSARSRSRLALAGGVSATALENGAIRATLKAPQALYEPAFHRITASGGIEAVPLEKGKPRARVKAPQAVYRLDAKTIDAVGGSSATIYESGMPRANVTSEALRYELGPKRVTLDGSVEATLLAIAPGDKVARLFSPKTVWKLDEKSLNCPLGGRLTRGTFVLEAASLSANLKTGLYAVARGHGSFELDEIKELNP